jgi:cytosine/creatinine deaminase
MHAHLDKGHIVTRTENPDGSFAGALQSTTDDCTQRWTAEDIKRRMEFGLRCAYVHGVAAIRTHLDSLEPDQAHRSWAVFREARTEWADRILLQAVALVPIDGFRTPYGAELADLAATSGGILGGVTRAVGGVHGRLLDDIDPLLDTMLRLASERGLDVDLPVDGSGGSGGDRARACCRCSFTQPIQGSRGLWPSLQPCGPARRANVPNPRSLRRGGYRGGHAPTVNLYLQDRCGERTPRWRGVAPVHENAPARHTGRDRRRQLS